MRCGRGRCGGGRESQARVARWPMGGVEASALLCVVPISGQLGFMCWIWTASWAKTEDLLPENLGRD